MTELATGLSQYGWKIRVYCAQPSYHDVSQRDNDVSKQMTYKGVEIIRVPTISDQHSGLLFRVLNALSYLLMTAFFLVRDRASIVGIFNTTNPPILGLAAVLARWLTGLRFITLVYDVYPDVAVCTGILKPRSLLTKGLQTITSLILHCSNSLIVIGEDMACVVRKKLKTGHQIPVELIRNWSDEKQVYPVPDLENPFVKKYGLSNKFVIQYSGRMGLTHNLEPLIKAASLLQDEQVIFQFIGDGAKRKKLEQMVKNLNLKNVQFLPYQPFGDLMNVLSAPHLSVVCLETNCTGYSVPSKSYGIMAAGRPMLGFLAQESEVGQMIKEFRCGIVMPDPTGYEVVEVILNLLDDPDRVARMGENGYKAFLENFTLKIAVEKYSEFLNDHFPMAKRSMVIR